MHVRKRKFSKKASVKGKRVFRRKFVRRGRFSGRKGVRGQGVGRRSFKAFRSGGARKKFRAGNSKSFKTKVVKAIQPSNPMVINSASGTYWGSNTQAYFADYLGVSAVIREILANAQGATWEPFFTNLQPYVDKVLLEHWSRVVTFRNAGSDAVIIDAYPFIARRDVPIAESLVSTIFANGFQSDEMAPRIGPMVPLDVGATPFMSRSFCSYFKIGKRIRRTLAGANLSGSNMCKFVTKNKPRLISSETYHISSTTTDPWLMRKGVGRGFLFILRGDANNDNSGGAATLPNFGCSKGAVDILMIERLSWKTMPGQYKQSAYVSTMDSYTGASQHINPYTGLPQIWTNNWNGYVIPG